MVSKVLLSLSALVAVVAAVPPGAGGWGQGWGPASWGWGPAAWGWGAGAGAWGPGSSWGQATASTSEAARTAGPQPKLPPWVAAAPWFPQFSACSTLGSECIDCNSVAICTKIGGFQKTCDVTKPHCNLGKCSETPSAECAAPEPAPEAPAAPEPAPEAPAAPEPAPEAPAPIEPVPADSTQ